MPLAVLNRLLNQVTTRRFEENLQRNPFAIEQIQCIPIRRLEPLDNQVIQERMA